MATNVRALLIDGPLVGEVRTVGALERHVVFTTTPSRQPPAHWASLRRRAAADFPNLPMRNTLRARQIGYTRAVVGIGRQLAIFSIETFFLRPSDAIGTQLIEHFTSLQRAAAADSWYAAWLRMVCDDGGWYQKRLLPCFWLRQIFPQDSQITLFADLVASARYRRNAIRDTRRTTAERSAGVFPWLPIMAAVQSADDPTMVDLLSAALDACIELRQCDTAARQTGYQSYSELLQAIAARAEENGFTELTAELRDYAAQQLCAMQPAIEPVRSAVVKRHKTADSD